MSQGCTKSSSATNNSQTNAICSLALGDFENMAPTNDVEMGESSDPGLSYVEINSSINANMSAVITGTQGDNSKIGKLWMKSLSFSFHKHSL